MNNNLLRILLIPSLVFLFNSKIYSQDPHFTQFSNIPLSINPAQIGVFSSPVYKTLEEYFAFKSSFYCNYRNQWMGSSSSFSTGAALYQMRFGDAGINERGIYRRRIIENPINFGVGMMFDRSLNGILKGNYLAMAASYHLPLSEKGENGGSSLGIGVTLNYTSRLLDLSRISFSQQFTSGGFDLTLPNGESGISNMKPFYSFGVGLLYSFRDEIEENFIKVGISGFNLNEPKQTITYDENQFLKRRITFNATWIRDLNGSSFIETQLLYQNQGKVNEFVASCFYHIVFPSGNEAETRSIGCGLYYRHLDAISPCLTLNLNRLILSSSYDVTSSNLKNGLKPSKSMEFSLQYFFNKANE